MSMMQFNMACVVYSMNYRISNMLRMLRLQGSACLVNYESYQRRSPIPRSGIVIAFQCCNIGTDLAPIC